MADRLTDRTAITTVAFDDVIHIVDVSNTTQNAAGSSFKITVGDFLNSLGVGIRMAVFPGYTVFKASGNTDLTELEVGDRIEGSGSFYTGDYVIVTVATSPVIDENELNTPIYRNASS